MLRRRIPVPLWLVVAAGLLFAVTTAAVAHYRGRYLEADASWAEEMHAAEAAMQYAKSQQHKAQMAEEQVRQQEADDRCDRTEPARK